MGKAFAVRGNVNKDSKNTAASPPQSPGSASAWAGGASWQCWSEASHSTEASPSTKADQGPQVDNTF